MNLIPLYGNVTIKKWQDKIAILSKKAHEVYDDPAEISNIKNSISKLYILMLKKLTEK